MHVNLVEFVAQLKERCVVQIDHFDRILLCMPATHTAHFSALAGFRSESL